MEGRRIAALDQQRAYYAAFARRLNVTRRESLDRQIQADCDLL
jgi:hypothetical protein